MTGLYDPRFEHDACGIGFVADLSGTASRAIVDAGLDGLCGVKHRGAVAADEKSGDGAGVLLPLPAEFFAAVRRPAVDPARLGVAMCFLDGQDGAEGDRQRAAAQGAVEQAPGRVGAAARRLARRPRRASSALGDLARDGMPRDQPGAVPRPRRASTPGSPSAAAYLARRRAERTLPRRARFAPTSRRSRSAPSPTRR